MAMSRPGWVITALTWRRGSCRISMSSWWSTASTVWPPPMPPTSPTGWTRRWPRRGRRTSPTRAASLDIAEASVEQVSAGYRAYNRWLADFRSVAPERWLGMAAISFHDVDAAVKEVHQAGSLGFAGIAVPAVPDT